ncbi:ficolin-1-like [Branchiostoma lanceolatum]|uniref:ficolin-1-like n=1 Tax=Branchiostoma lanceolatum TaxID=7740 RepID=UPI0034556C82
MFIFMPTSHQVEYLRPFSNFVAMALISIVVVVLLHQLRSTTAQVVSEEPAGWPVTDVGEHGALTGSCLAYGELLQYLTRQDKLESELEGLKNETQRCCEGQWALWIDSQQQSVSSLQVNVDNQTNMLQQQQATVQQLQATVGEQANINQQQQATMQHQQATMQQLQATVDDQVNIIQQQGATIQQMQTLLSQLSDKVNSARDCMELLATGHDTSGVYTIYPDGGGKSPVHVYCDMDTDGGGWTLFQKRQDGSVNFYRDWQVYKTGFGDLRGEFWLGNDNLHRLTAQDVYELRVDLEDFEGNTAFAKYNIFRVEDEVHKYRLTVSGYSGTAGDAMSDPDYGHDGMYFSTRDRENDQHTGVDCAEHHTGAWWYNRCFRASLNGLYLIGDHPSHTDGIIWAPWKGSHYSLKTTEMKIRPN